MPQTNMDTANVIPRNVQSIGITEVRCKNNNPNQPVIGPGNTGKKEPTMPSKTKTNPRIKRKISIRVQ
ncbi:hypothetical protein KH5_04000 [Urechidicola sp. KH5]